MTIVPILSMHRILFIFYGEIEMLSTKYFQNYAHKVLTRYGNKSTMESSKGLTMKSVPYSRIRKEVISMEIEELIWLHNAQLLILTVGTGIGAFGIGWLAGKGKIHLPVLSDWVEWKEDETVRGKDGK